ESVIGGEKVGRFSFLGTEPFLMFEARGPEVRIAEAGAGGAGRRRASRDPLPELPPPGGPGPARARPGAAPVACGGPGRAGRLAGAAPVRWRGRRLCGVRRGPLYRGPAPGPARRPGAPRPGVRLL